MSINVKETGSLHSIAEDLFIELFCDTFGPEKSQFLFTQYPFVDIYGNRRFIDFAIENDEARVAIEIDGETYHNPNKVSMNKYYDDLLKQNSLVYHNWKVYRWAFNQLKRQPDRVKDELRTFIGDLPQFRMLEDYLPSQKGKAFELKKHQQSALMNLQQMRKSGETIALLYHATGTGKTVTAVCDAKTVGKSTLFLAHTKELIVQAKRTFEELWDNVSTGIYMGDQKDRYAHVICGSIQSVSQNIKSFRPDEFDYIIIDECHHGTASIYRKVLGYFKPEFTLGLTATPDRALWRRSAGDIQKCCSQAGFKNSRGVG